jgi:excisionase family DNA binding protein
MLTVAQVAARLNVHRDTVLRLIAAGRLEAFKAHPRAHWRINEAELSHLVSAGTRSKSGQGDA